jgi:hypothetical protein
MNPNAYITLFQMRPIRTARLCLASFLETDFYLLSSLGSIPLIHYRPYLPYRLYLRIGQCRLQLILQCLAPLLAFVD